MLGLGQVLKPSVWLAYECKVCKRLIDWEEVDQTKVQAKLFGAAKYAVCSCCGMETTDRSHGYKTRWTRYRKAHQ